MAKELMFKLRLDEADRQRLDLLAQHFSAPAATVIRMLIKREADAVARPVFDPLEKLPPADRVPYVDLLSAIRDGGERGLPVEGHGNSIAETMTALGYPKDHKQRPRMLNELRHAGYIAKHEAGYSITAKGEAWFIQHAG